MKIELKTKTKERKEKDKGIKVRIVRAPIVDSSELKRIIFARNKALVL